MREDQEQYQVQTHPGIGKPSPPTERCGTRQLTLLWARILLKKTEPFYLYQIFQAQNREVERVCWQGNIFVNMADECFRSRVTV